MDKEQARKLYELADRLSKLDINTLSEQQLAERSAMIAQLQEVKQRLDPKCWSGYKKQGTKMKGDTRVNNCVPEGVAETKLDELTGWKQSTPQKRSAPAPRKTTAAELLAKSDDKRSTLQRQKDAGKKNWFAEEQGEMEEGYTVTPGIDRERYQARDGLEGPFSTKSGKVVYYDKQEGKYYDPDTDMYIEYDDWQAMNEDAEYNDEAGMAESNLHTMARAVAGLIKTIEADDNLPEWAQEKIAKAEMMITSVWDYLLSQKEQGVDPKVQESKKPSPKLTPVNIKKTDAVSEEINTEAYERLQKVFAFKNYES